MPYMRVRLYITLLVLLNCLTDTAAYNDHRNRNVDSLEHVLHTNPPSDKAQLLRMYDNLAWGFLETDGNKTQDYCDRGIALAKELENHKTMAECYRLKGMRCWGEARYDEAEKMLQKAGEAVEMMKQSKKYEEGEIDDLASSIDGTLGNLYNTLGNGAKALEYYHRALKVFRKHAWRESETIAYGNIAELYYCMGNLERAEEYYLHGDSVALLTQDPLVKTFCQEGLAKICMLRGDTKEAWQTINQVADYLFAHPEEEGSSRVTCLETMADIALREGDYAKARDIVKRNEGLCDSLQYESSSLLQQKARIAMYDQQWHEAEKLALGAMHLNEEAQDVMYEVYKLLAEIYAHLGDADQTKLFTEKADSVRTEWNNYAYQASLSEQEMRFDSEQKNIQIISLSRQRMYLIWIVVVAVVLILALGVVFVLVKRNHKRQKALLAAKVALDAETKERSLLAKDLHDGLGGMLTLQKLKLDNNEVDEAKKLLDDSIMEMRRMAHHIMPEELQQNGLVTSLQDFAISVPGAQFHYFGDNHRLKPEMELVLYRCAYELVNNAMKHSGAEHIDIQLMVDKAQVALTVSDNGQGFEQKEPSAGMGLKSIKNRIAQFDGKMEIISLPGQGTDINITLQQ